MHYLYSRFGFAVGYFSETSLFKAIEFILSFVICHIFEKYSETDLLST